MGEVTCETGAYALGSCIRIAASVDGREVAMVIPLAEDGALAAQDYYTETAGDFSPADRDQALDFLEGAAQYATANGGERMGPVGNAVIFLLEALSEEATAEGVEARAA